MDRKVLCQCPVCIKYTCKDPDSSELVQGQVLEIGDAKRHRSSVKKRAAPPVISKKGALDELNRRILEISLFGSSDEGDCGGKQGYGAGESAKMSDRLF